MANLKEKYTQELRPALQEELGINNVMAVPKLTKIVINMELEKEQMIKSIWNQL